MKNRVSSSEQHSVAPFWAIVQTDLKGLLKSRITFGWLLAALFIEVIRALGAQSAGTTSSVVPSGLSDFVYIWSLVIIGLAASSVSSEAGELADSVMSKSVTRLDYVLGKFASRIAYTLIGFSVVTAVLVGLSLKLEKSDYNDWGLIFAVLLVALMLIMLTTVGVGLSIAMPSTVMAIVILLLAWYFMTIFFPVLGLDVLSPGSVVGKLPDIVKGSWSLADWESVAGFIGISGAFTALSSVYFYMKDI